MIECLNHFVFCFPILTPTPLQTGLVLSLHFINQEICICQDTAKARPSHVFQFTGFPPLFRHFSTGYRLSTCPRINAVLRWLKH
jgi:hypothetical protein